MFLKYRSISLNVRLRCLLLFILSYFFSPLLCSAEDSQRPVSHFEFDLNFNITHNVISGDFLDRAGNELLIVGEKNAEKNGEKNKSVKIMALYGFDRKKATFIQLDEYVLPESIVVFDTITDISGKENVVLLSATRLSLINFNAISENLELKTDPRESIIQDEFSSIYANPKPQFIAKKNLVRDLNGDGYDDIVISGFSGVIILLQTEVDGQGQFVVQNLPINSIIDMGKEQIAFVERQFFSVDANFDQMLDIVLAGEGELHIYEQLGDHTFTGIPEIVSLPMNVSGIPWWYLRDSDGETADQSSLHHQKLESIMDINGDGHFDLVIMSTESSGLLDRQNRYDIHFGNRVAGKLIFSKIPETQISSEGTLTGLQLLDVDEDGLQEVFVVSFDIGLTQIIGALISGKIKQKVFFFSLNEDNKYNQQANFAERVNLNFSLTKGRVGEPVIETADLDGDGLMELILSASSNKLAIHTGIADSKPFISKPEYYKVELPEEGSMLTVNYIFSKLKKDIVIRYGRQDDVSLRRKIRILSF